MAAKAMAAAHHVLDCGHAGEYPRRLEGADQAEVCDLHRRQTGKIAPREHHSPGVARHDVGDEIEHRGLARAVRADQGGDLVRLCIERNVVDGLQAAKALGEVAHAQDGAFTRLDLRTGRAHDFTASVLTTSRGATPPSREIIWITPP